MGNTPAPIPHIGQLLLGHERRGRDDALFFLVLGLDGKMTIWIYVSSDHYANWERPVDFENFDQITIDGVPAKRLITEKLAAKSK